MQAGSKLRLAWTSRNQGIARAVSQVSRIVMESGSEILSNLPRNIDFPPITLNGDASVTMPSTGVHGRSFSFKAIEGAHNFSLVSCHRCKYVFTSKSTVSAFVTNVIGTSELHAKAPGCFGPGDVSLNLGPTHGQVLKLFLGSSNAISSTATLSLTSKSSRFGQGKIEIGLAAGVTQAVADLVVDGVSAKKGSYRAGTRNLGGANVTFVGDGELIVKGDAVALLDEGVDADDKEEPEEEDGEGSEGSLLEEGGVDDEDGALMEEGDEINEGFDDEGDDAEGENADEEGAFLGREKSSKR